jgi:hypothetical protein
MFPALFRQVGEAGLKALEERVGVFVGGDVGEHFVGDVGQGALLNLCLGQLGADHVGRGGAGHGEHAALHRRPLELFLHLGHGRLVLGGVVALLGEGRHEVARRRGHLAPESLDAPGLKVFEHGQLLLW